MIYDRPYMREPSPQNGSSQNLIKYLIVANVTVFILQMLLGSGFPETILALNQGNWLKAPWSIVTYSFMHDVSFLHDARKIFPWHILVNMLMLYFIGKNLEQYLTQKQLGTLYFGCLLSGAIVWVAANWGSAGATLIGASAGVMGLLTYFCLNKPNEPVTFLLFFVIPVTIKPKFIAWAMFIFGLFGLVFGELQQGTGTVNTIAHSAHLGGMLGAVLFYRYGMGRELYWLPFLRFSRSSKPMGRKKPMQPVKYSVQFSDRDKLQREVDRILDKINAKGFGALTPEEKKILDQAKDVLKR